jgi:hypothetical protein
MKKIYTTMKEIQKSIEELKNGQKLIIEDITNMKERTMSKENDRDFIEVYKFLLLFK